MADTLEYEAKARSLIKEAEKQQKGFFKSLFGSSNKEEIADKYSSAANFYKLAKCWGEACSTYEKVRDIMLKDGLQSDAADAMVQAATCASKAGDPARSQSLTKQAIAIYVQLGRLYQAGKLFKDAATTAKKEGDTDTAIMLYTQAREMFAADHRTSDENSCKLELAPLYIEQDKFDQAIELYENVGKTYAENNLLKFGAKDHLLNAGLLHLCKADLATAESKVEEYLMWDPTFDGSRQHSLLANIIAAIKDGNVDAFTATVAEYDRMTRLDSTRTNLLLRIKKSVGAMSASAAGGEPDIGDLDLNDDLDLT